MYTKTAYSVPNSLIITHLGENANKTVLNYPNPNSLHIEHEIHGKKSITIMQYDQI